MVHLAILAADFASVDTARTGSVPVSALPALLAAHLQRQPTPTESQTAQTVQTVVAADGLSSAVTFAAWARWVYGENPPADTYVIGPPSSASTGGGESTNPGDIGQVFFIAGYPSAGKTFMGDYLATRGWEHVDGDCIANPEAKAMGSEAKVEAFWAAMQKVFKGGTADREEWVPYYDLLIELTKRACEKKKDVVLTYAVFGIFGGERELFKEHFPNMKFINVKVDHAQLIERFWNRHEKMKEQAGFTDQQYWDYHEMDEARAEYGPAFSKENMTKFMEKTVYNPRLINMPPSEPECFEIDNNDTGSDTAFKQLNEIAGLPCEKVDTDAIAQVNYERYNSM